MQDSLAGLNFGTPLEELPVIATRRQRRAIKENLTPGYIESPPAFARVITQPEVCLMYSLCTQ